MKKILITLLIAPLLMALMLSFSVQAEDIPPLTTASSGNVPNGGDGKCSHQSGDCSIHK
jgi:hypothetical protein